MSKSGGIITLSKKIIFLTCVAILLLSCLSLTTATDINDNSTNTHDTITTTGTHVTDNVQSKSIDNNYDNSDLDTSNSVTTNSIGEKNTSQTSNTTTTNKEETTDNTDNTDVKTIQKVNKTKTVKQAQSVYYINSWNDFRYYLQTADVNSTFIFNQGQTYTVTSDSLVWSKNVRLRNLTIIGNGAIIDGRNSYGFLHVGGDRDNNIFFTLNVSNLTFKDCGQYGLSSGMGGVIYGIHKPTIYISNCTFNNSKSPVGGAIVVHRGNLTITDTVFINSSSTQNGGAIRVGTEYANLTVDNVTFTDSKSPKGAAIVFEAVNGNVKITNTNFINGKSDDSAGNGRGSAIYLQEAESLYLENNTFVNNTAIIEGAIYIDKTNYGQVRTIINNTFINNNATYGAAISVNRASDLIIENSTFLNNSATDGGAILIKAGVEGHFTGNRYENNTAENGGVLYVHHDADIQLNDETFTNNSATNGAAIYSEGKITSIDNKFHNLTATNGGALYLTEGSSNFNGTNDVYENNSADYGGAVYISNNAQLTSNTGVFKDNNASIGGVFYIENNGQFDTNYDQCYNNTAVRGGVFYVNQTARAIEAEGSNYTDNKATEYGGVLYMEKGMVDSEDETYLNNTALVGGAIYNLGGTIDSINNRLINNTALYGGASFNSENGTIIKRLGTNINNTALIGGAIYNNGTLTSIQGTFEENNATIGGVIFNNGMATAQTNTFKNNNASLGGAVYNNATISATSNTFITNNATNGGALVDNGTFSGTGNNYYNNTAEENGGAIYSCTNKVISIQQIELEGNHANQNGGAFFTEENVTIVSSHDVRYVNNSANLGGAVYLSNSSNLNTSADEFISNTAIEGGAIYASANNTVVVKTKTLFDSNNATCGAAVYLNDSTTLNTNDAVYKNGNATNGSVIYAQTGSKIVSRGNEFIANNAENGALYINEGVNIALTSGNYINNTATNGAAIYTKSDLNTTGLTFTGNNATLGGSVYLDEVNYNSKQDTFTGNNATEGGAIYVSDNSVANISSSTFTQNNANTGGALYLNGSSVVNSTGSTYRQNNATSGGVYYIPEYATVNVLGNDMYTVNNAEEGAVFYNEGNINSTNSEYNKGTATSGGVLYNAQDANFTSTQDRFTQNSAQEGAVLVNNGNVTITESTIDSNTGTNSVILNNKYLTLTDNIVSNNVVTSSDGYVIQNNVVTATIVNNIFDSNTDLTRDMLLADVQPESISGNTYIDNFLNDTMEVSNYIEVPLDVLEYYVNITLNLSNIYNDTVRNGTVTFYDETLKNIGEGVVVNGTANVRIKRIALSKALTDVTVVYQSLSHHYQDMYTRTQIHLGTATRIRFDPINQTYVDDKINVTARLFEVESSTPLYNANITVYINGTKYTGNTTDKGYITITDVSFDHTGLYPMNATFEGNGSHEYSTVNGTVEVIKVPTHLTLALPANVTHPDDEGYINATLYDSRDNSTLRVFNITLNVTGKEGYVALPDENGNISYLFRAYENGHIQVVASVHESTDKYAIPEEVSGELFIERYHTHFHNNNSQIVTDGSETNVTFTLYDPDHNLIKNKAITITITVGIPGEEPRLQITKDVSTDEVGSYSESLIFNAGEEANITADCIEDYKYRDSSLPVHLIAGKNVTWVALSPENIYVNQTPTIRINLGENGDNPFTGTVRLTVVGYDSVDVEVTDGQVYYTNSSMSWPERTMVQVLVYYPGDDSHTDSLASATFTVFRAATNTTIAVTENLDTKTVIVGNVTSEGYPPINIGNVTLTAEYTNLTTGNRESIDLGNATVTDGQYTLITDKLMRLQEDYGRYDIKAVYNTNDVFYESQAATGTVRITSFRNTTIRIINNPSTMVGSEESILFALSDDKNEPLVNKTLTITINGTSYQNRNLTTDNRGYVVVQTSFSEVGVNNITASFEGNDYYNSSSNIGNITVKQRTIIQLTVPSPIHVYDNVTINITLTDIDGNPLANQNIIANDHEHQDTFTTDENGTISIDVIYTTYGTKTVTAEFAGSLLYASSNTTDIIQVLRLDTILNVSAESPVIIGNVTTLDGYLVLHNGTPIKNATVSMYINDATEAINLKTDENGYYHYNYTTEVLGRNNVKVVFETNNVYWGFEDNQVFIVKAYITDISVTADRLIKVGDTTSITGILEDEFGNRLANKIVNLTVNGEVVDHDITNENGEYSFVFTQAKDGLYNITVNFTGDNKYMKSFDTYQIKVEKIITHINITGTSPVNYGNRITVEAVLFDEYGNKLARENITVYINGTETAKLNTRGEGDVEYSYMANVIDLQNITLKYPGTDKYYPSNNTYQVNVLKLYTHFDDLSATNVEIGLNSTIAGYLIDESGRGLGETEFNVTLNENESTTKTVKTDSRGRFIFEYNSTELGINNVTLSYGGSYSQESVEDYVTFTVDKLDVFIEVNVTNYKAGNTTILVNVTDENGNAIPEGTVLVYYNEEGELIGNGTVGEDGTAEINITVEPGMQDITVVYNGSDLYKYTSTIVNLNVPKYELNLTISVINDTKVRNSTNITGYLFYEDSEETPIVGENVTIIVDGIEIANVTTGEDGNYSCQYNATTSGFKEVSVVFLGNDTHSRIEATGNFTVEKINSTVTINTIENTTVDYNVTITGELKDEFDIFIPGANITIEINGVNYTNTTDEEGRFSYEYITSVVGINNITVYYDGNNTFNKTLNTQTFNVTAHPTNITANITNPKAGNNLITINVTDENKNNVTTGNVIIKEDENQLASGMIVNGVLVTAIQLEPGEHVLTIEYEGITNYAANTTTYTVTIPKYNTTIIPEAINAIKLNKTIYVNGTLLDQYNRPVGPTSINISINEINVTVDVDADGKFTYQNTTNVTGINNVTVTYDGNDTYNASSVSFNFTVSPIFAQLSVNATSPVVVTSNTTINVYLVDENDNAIAGVNVTIFVNDEEVVNVTTGEDGSYSYNYTTSIVGLNNVTVEFAGNENYTAVNRTTNFLVDKMFTAVNVTTVSPIKVGSNTTISGRLVDGRGNPIESAVINITVGDNDKYNTTTSSDGYYTLNVTGTTVGEYKVKVFYNGSEVFIESNNTGKFIVELYNTNVAVNNSEVVNGKTNITVNVTDEFDNPIPGGFVNITDEDGNVLANGTIGENGNLTTNITLTPGRYNIIVVYNGTDNSTPVNRTIVIDVPKYNANLTLENINDTIVRNSTNITGFLVDENNEAIEGAKLTITVNDIEIANVTTGEDGNYTVTYNATTVGEKQVVVNFAGDDTYAPLSTNKTFKVDPVHTNITVSGIDNITIGGVVNIKGTLVDELGANVSNVEVIITVNGKNYTATTDEYGNYSYNYTTVTVGLNNVTVTFIGDSNILGTVNSTNFNVTRINTTTRANISSPRVGANVIEVNVTETISGLNVTSGPVEVRNDEDEVLAIGQVINGTAYIPVSGLQAGQEYNFTIVYNQTNVYEESSYKFNVTIPKHVISVIPDVVNPMKIGETNEITGTLVNENNEPLADTEVNVTVNGETRLVKTNSSGKYNYTYTANVTGTNNVTVSYEGEGYEPLEYKYNFTVDKLFSVINVTADSPIVVGNNTTISGRLVDENGESISDVNVTITVNGVNVHNATTNDGYYSYNVTGSVVGLNNVTVEFAGNENYTAVNRTTNFLVDKMFTAVNVTTVSPIKVGTNTTISGRLVDGRGNPIGSAVINVTVGDNDKYNTTTYSDGYYTLNVTGTAVGEYKVKVFYNGSEVFIESNNTGKFIVELYNTNVAVNNSEVVDGKVNITVNVTDEDGNVIPGGFVNITDEDGNVLANGTIGENGNLTTNITLTPGRHNITVVYNGTDNSTPVNRTIVIDVPKYTASLTLEDINDTIVRNSTNITGFLVDENEEAIIGADIIVMVNDIVVANVTTGSNGEYSVVYNATSIGDKVAVVKFAGDDTYAPLEVNKTFTVSPIHTNITVPTIENITIGGIVTINGTLTDELGLNVSDVEVIVTVNGRNYTAITDENGTYTYNYTTGIAGVNNITVTFIGDENIIGTTNSTTFNVTKIETTVSAEFIAAVDGTSLIEVNVTDEFGLNVTDGQITIKDGDDIVAVGRVINGTAIVPVTTEAGKQYDFTVLYDGTDIYLNSSTTAGALIDKLNTTIIPDVINAVKVNDTIYVNGTLLDQYNRPVGPTSINISINEINVTVDVDADGKFTYQNTTNVTGINNVSIAYDGNATYADSEVSFNFTVSPIFTQITVNATSPVIITNDTTISGVLKDEKGNTIADAEIEVWINDGLNKTVITGSEGQYTYTVEVDTLGLNNVTVVYKGSANYTAVNATTNYYVDKMFTAVNVTTVSPVKVGTNTTISGRLVDGRGNPIGSAVINITVGDNDKYNTTTYSDGYYTLNVTGTTVGEYKVKVFYNGSEVFIESNNTAKFIVEEYNTNVVINISEIVDGKVNITVNVTDEDGNVIPGGFVNITDEEGNVIANGTIDENGNLTTNITLTPGRHNITVVYNGTDNSTPVNRTIVIDVPMYTASLTLEDINDTIVRNSTNITGFLVGENNKAIKDANIIVVVNGIVVAKVTTGKDGNYSVTYNATTVGNKKATVKFAGDDTYAPLEVNKTFTVSPIHTNVTLSTIENTTIGNVVTIEGVLTDEFTNNVAYVEVILTVNGKNYTTSTDSDGKYSYDYATSVAGENNVIVTFVGDENILGTSNTTKFNVTKVTSNVVAEIVTPKAGTSLIEVNVTDSEGNRVTDGIVEIKNGDEVVATGKIVNGTAVIPVETEPGKSYEFDVVYTGTSIYANSTNKIEKTEIPNHNLSVIPDPVEPTKVGNTTTISGTIVDENNKALSGVEVNVTINGETHTVVTDENGRYSYPYTTNSSGTNNITVSYESDGYNKLEYKYNFTVELVDTTTTFETPSTQKIGVPTTINGTLVDQNGKEVPNADITIKVGNITINTKTDKDGKYTASYTPNKLGFNEVTVTYDGNETYRATNNSGAVNVDKIDTVITLNNTSSLTIGENNTFSGVLKDQYAKVIANADITIKVNNKTITTSTNNKGEYSVSYTTTTAGVNNVTVNYAGNGTYYPISTSKVFTVNKLESSIDTSAITGAKLGETIPINGTILDENNKPVSGANVTITINGKNHTVTTDKDGKYSYPYTVDTVGVNNITVTLPGDDNLDTQSKSYSFNVDKIATATVFNTSTTVKVGTQTTIAGVLIDENEKAVANANITVKVGNKSQTTTTDKNGKYSVKVVPTTMGINSISVSYLGDNTYKSTRNTGVLYVDKLDTLVTTNVTSPIKVGKTEKVTGTLLDENNNAITNAKITVKVNDKSYTTTTNSKGVYSISYPTTTTGTNNVTVSYAGDNNNYPIITTRKFTVEKLDVVVDVSMPDVSAGTSNIVANIMDENGKPVSEGTVTITTPDGKKITAAVKNGKVNVTVPTTPGKQTYKVTYNGEDDYSPSTISLTKDVPKYDTKLKVDKLKASKVDETTTVTGKLTSSDGKAIPNAKVTVKYGDTTKVVTTDSKGKFTAKISDIRAGTNNITVTYDGNDTYDTSSAKITQVVNKYPTKVSVDEISGIIGEKITLIAHVTDEKGNKVSGGNLVFKLNGKTLRSDYRFDSSATPLKFKVVDGKVKVTLTADLYLRNAKNLTASYSGSYKYEANTSKVVTAQIQKRRATLRVTTVPATVKQDSNIIFKAYLTDVTKNAKNKTSISTDATVIFKINGNTIKDDGGSQIHVEVVNGVATYTYYIEPGIASVDKNGTVRNYSVESVYENPSFYPDTRNKTVYNVEKSDVTVNFIKTTVKSNKLSIKASLTDYKGNYLVGKNTVVIKINGKTYNVKGKVKYFDVIDGKVNLSGLKLASGTHVKSVTLVTGERQAYHAVRATTTEIST